MTRFNIETLALTACLALATPLGALQAQEPNPAQRIAVLAAENALIAHYSDFDYKVEELIRMQSLAVLEGFAGKAPDSGSYRSDRYKLNEWMPHYEGQLARLRASVARLPDMDDSDAAQFLAAMTRFNDLVTGGERIVSLLKANDVAAAHRTFREDSLEIAKGIRRDIYTLKTRARDRFRAAARAR